VSRLVGTLYKLDILDGVMGHFCIHIDLTDYWEKYYEDKKNGYTLSD
jgi:hypothetical protein